MVLACCECLEMSQTVSGFLLNWYVFLSGRWKVSFCNTALNKFWKCLKITLNVWNDIFDCPLAGIHQGILFWIDMIFETYDPETKARFLRVFPFMENANCWLINAPMLPLDSDNKNRPRTLCFQSLEVILCQCTLFSDTCFALSCRSCECRGLGVTQEWFSRVWETFPKLAIFGIRSS